MGGTDLVGLLHMSVTKIVSIIAHLWQKTKNYINYSFVNLITKLIIIVFISAKLLLAFCCVHDCKTSLIPNT